MWFADEFTSSQSRHVFERSQRAPRQFANIGQDPGVDVGKRVQKSQRCQWGPLTQISYALFYCQRHSKADRERREEWKGI